MVELITIQTDSLTFLLTDKIIVKTKLQTFYLTPNDNQAVRLFKIRTQIEQGGVKNLDDLARVCGTTTKWRAKL